MNLVETRRGLSLNISEALALNSFRDPVGTDPISNC